MKEAKTVTKIYAVLDYRQLWANGGKGNPFELTLGWSKDEKLAKTYSRQVMPEKFKEQAVHPMSMENFLKHRSERDMEALEIHEIDGRVYTEYDENALDEDDD